MLSVVLMMQRKMC